MTFHNLFTTTINLCHTHSARWQSQCKRRLTLLGIAVITMTAIGACGSSSTADDPDAASAPELDAPAPMADAANPSIDAPPATVDANPGGADATPISSCGGIIGNDCGSGAYCDFRDNRCGGGENIGSCERRPDLCQPVSTPVCGCDRMVYENECEASLAGTDIDSLGTCDTPANTFGCGQRYCRQGIEYCEQVVADIVGEPNRYTCKPIPQTCSGRGNCACLTDEPCGDSCEDDAGDLTLTCPGG